MAELSNYDTEYFLFLEGGFIAINQADEDAAVKLFKACELLRPENILYKVGMGYLHLHKLELKTAIQYFEEALQKEPNNEMAKTFLGIAMTLTPDQVTKGEKILEQAVSGTQDAQIKQVIQTSLDFVENYVKKPGAQARPANK